MPSSFAQKSFSQAMLKATRLTGKGKLLDATRLIQLTLFGEQPASKTHTQTPTKTHKQPHTRPVPLRADSGPPPVIVLPAPGVQQPQPIAIQADRQASFTKHSYAFEGKSFTYRMYIPSATQSTDSRLMPMVVLLHGCQQDALDFAHGTAMNELAEQHHVMVLYPEQTTSGNAMRCWNWFEPGHQQAGRGEPGMIAALTQKIIAQHGADPARIYVAGLSAGGAMAAVVAGLYPDVFAAVGVHSGLAAGAAQNVMSAFNAMRTGAKGHKTTAMPTIVFHGTGDTTVHPENSEFIADAALAALKASGQSLVKSKSRIESSTAPSSAEYAERTVYSNNSGIPFVESWTIQAGPHAWSGGSAQGSYTDPDGPDASAAMLVFFLQHKNSKETT